jgi:peptidyl-prolyl cis-trans isomerase A (cyclophilin A)
MKRYYVIFRIVLFLAFFGGSVFGQQRNPAGQQEKPAVEANPVVVIKTELGDIEVELYSRQVPITVKNFLAYIDSGMYKDATFHRTVRLDNQPRDSVKIVVIQGSRASGGKRDFPAIELERTNKTGLQHKDGTISMARGVANSAMSSFFICIGDQPELDFGGKRNTDGQGFAAFGTVIKGMDIVKKINQSPVLEQPGSQTLKPPIKIFEIVRKK